MATTDHPAVHRGSLAPGDWKLASHHSSLGFSTRAMGWLPVRGSFSGFDGEVHVDQSGDVSGGLTISAETIRTGIKMRDKDLRGKKFFAVDHYPHISFALNSLAPAAGGGVTVAGSLTIRDQTQLINTPATIVQVGADDVRVDADFEVDHRRAGFNPKGLPRSVRVNASLMLTHED